MTGIKATGRGPHRSSIVPDHKPVTTFDPQARAIGLSLTALVVLGFTAWLLTR